MTGAGATEGQGKVDNGTLCDANDVEIATSVTFPLGLGYGCDPIEVEYTLTCDWSARGNRTTLWSVVLRLGRSARTTARTSTTS